MPSENGLKWQTFHDTELHESQKDLLSIGARCGVKMLFQSYNRPCKWLHLKQWILYYIDIRPSPHFKNLTCKMGLSAKLFLWKSLSHQNPCDCLEYGLLIIFFLLSTAQIWFNSLLFNFPLRWARILKICLASIMCLARLVISNSVSNKSPVGTIWSVNVLDFLSCNVL